MDFRNSIIGMVGTFGGFIAAMNVASDVLKFATLLIGFAIGCHSIYKILKAKS